MLYANKLKNFKNKIKWGLNVASQKSDDIYAMSILQPLLSGKDYLAINGGALRPFCLAYILNEIIINKRKSIIEFGSGISTILIARLIKENGLPVSFVSVEHNIEWIEVLNKQLKRENLTDFVKIEHINLVDQNTEIGKVLSYDSKSILNITAGNKYDLIIVDGPPANTSKIRYSRYPVFLNLRKNLFNEYCLIIDDANRKGEKEIINRYKNSYPKLEFSLVGKTLGVFRSSLSFNPIPLYYSKRK